MNAEQSRIRPEDPSSERWLQYYQDARVRRRARGPEERTSAKRRRWRIRQRVLAAASFAVVALVLSICYAVLNH